jgi:CheY-like chemotaxis protein
MGLVLVVEDDDDLRDAICQVLEEPGIDAIRAANGAEALQLLETGVSPNVILLDLMMPVMNGWMFRQHQQADPRAAEIPVIVMSAAPRLEEIALDGVDLVQKPVQLDELLGRVRALLDAREFDGVPPTVRDASVLRELDLSDSERTKS